MMVSNPVVLIFSEGKCSPEDIAKNIINENANTDSKTINLDLSNQSETIGVTMNIRNKYFTTELLLVSIKDDISMIPLQLLKNAEAILVYFDSNDKNFTTRILNYTDFVTSNNIELGVLICDSLYNDSKDGITYADIKSECTTLDIVELAEHPVNSTEANGYSEICEIFNNFIWSSVKHKDTTLLPSLEHPEDENNTCSPPREIANEFRTFEKLLSDVLSFKNTAEILPREERLIYAEQFAKEFEPLLEDLCSDEES